MVPEKENRIRMEKDLHKNEGTWRMLQWSCGWDCNVESIIIPHFGVVCRKRSPVWVKRTVVPGYECSKLCTAI